MSSRMGVIYLTLLFNGILGLQSVTPLMLTTRAAFYREKQSNMYSEGIYTLALILIEIPFLILSSLAFTLPFFYVVGFNLVGSDNSTTGRFFEYWAFTGFYMAVLVYMGIWISFFFSSKSFCDVVSGFASTIFSVFCGFLITPTNIPTFWIFLYYINPLSYALQGIILSQFYGDLTVITLADGTTTTAQDYVSTTTGWNYNSRLHNLIYLFIFMFAFWIFIYLSLAFVNHDQR